MKKASLIFFVIILFIISCQKKQNWDCKCGPPGTTTTTYTTTIENATKNNASDLCNKAASQNLANGSYACQISAQ
jgi:hypothetical protein